MGAWGSDTFDNDTACDWKYDLEESDGLPFVEATLERVLALGESYLDSDDACCGLAACEVVARLKGNWGARNSYTESLDAWVVANQVQPSAELVRKSLAVIDRILMPDSELLELWDGQSEWQDSVSALRARVAA